MLTTNQQYALKYISRASMFRELVQLQSQEIISQEQGWIWIKDRPKLETVLYR